MKKFLMILPVVAFFFISSHSANSMCVYNRSSVKDLEVCFKCGIFCENIWDLQPCPPSPETSSDCYACRPSKGGGLAAGVFSGIVRECNLDGGCFTKVADHGWVIITGTDIGNLKCTPFK